MSCNKLCYLVSVCRIASSRLIQFLMLLVQRLILVQNSQNVGLCWFKETRFLGSFTKFSPSFMNDCAAITLIGLGGTLKVAFVRKARLTLFHFESCCCIFGAGIIASSIVEYWKQTSCYTCHEDVCNNRLARESIAAEFRKFITLYNSYLLCRKHYFLRGRRWYVLSKISQAIYPLT